MIRIITILSFLISLGLNAQQQITATFKDCSMGDAFYLEFEGTSLDFSNGDNNYSGYDLCIEDEDGYTVPNPLYVGKTFTITWKYITKDIIPDATEPWKRERRNVPSIISMTLMESSAPGSSEGSKYMLSDYLGVWKQTHSFKNGVSTSVTENQKIIIIRFTGVIISITIIEDGYVDEFYKVWFEGNDLRYNDDRAGVDNRVKRTLKIDSGYLQQVLYNGDYNSYDRIHKLLPQL